MSLGSSCTHGIAPLLEALAASLDGVRLSLACRDDERGAPLSEPPRASSPKRLLEWRLGRIAAERAAEASTGSRAPIGRREDGAPIWPSGVVGSISHSDAHAVALTGSAALFAAVGVDLERVRERDAARLSRLIAASDAEAARMTRSPSAMTELFSLKEAALKAYASLFLRKPALTHIVCLPLDERGAWRVTVGETVFEAFSAADTEWAVGLCLLRKQGPDVCS